MNTLIALVNKLQEILVVSQLKYKINLPQIVCVGSQSSGKTSIIESIVNKDFLPKGTGMVTRRPLILQLKYLKTGNDYCEFLHKKGEKIEDFAQVTNEIVSETNRVAGRSKMISDEPIVLQIYSQKLIDLTLVDLPGLVKVPIMEQPVNIDILIRKMVLDFISNPNAIILAISPGNMDIANSDSLKLAREVDPYFNRTIGVISKVDLVEHPTDLVDIITNNVYPLKYGYIGVTCRNSQDNFNNKSLEDEIKEENERYQDVPEYKPITQCLGIQNLTKQLSKVLTEKIRYAIPAIKDSLTDEIFKKENELNMLGTELIKDNDEMAISSFILMSLFKFSLLYKEMIEGSVINPNLNKQYIGAAKINKLFTQTFKNEIQGIDPFSQLTNQEILIVIKNTNGLKPSLFVPELAFEVLIRQQIKRLEAPSLLCVKRVYDELLNTIDLINIPELNRYKALEIKIREIMQNIIEKCFHPTNKMIQNIIEIELSYINASHPDFLSNGNINEDNIANDKELEESNDIVGSNHKGIKLNNLNSSSIVNQHNNNSNLNDIIFNSREKMEIKIIKNLIVSYFNLVKKNICDLVPKTIMCFLVNKTKNISEQQMIVELYKSSEDIKGYLKEEPVITEKRKELKDSLTFLRNSLNVLNETK